MTILPQVIANCILTAVQTLVRHLNTSQLFFNSVIAASVYALVGVGFSVTYGTLRFFDFTQAVIFTVGAYFSFVFATCLQLPLLLAVLLAIAANALFGVGVHTVFSLRLRKRGASPLVLLLASMGLYVLLQNGLSLIFGDHIRSIRPGVVQEGFHVMGARITGTQFLTIACCTVILAVVSLALRKTSLGKAIRAVANSPALAEMCGIRSERVVVACFAMSSALAAVAGILVALDVDMTPTMGMKPFMMGVVAVIIGGVDSIPGIALGALLLAMAQQFGVWKISSQWQDAIAFAVLLVFLIFRPQGFFGKKIKKATV